MNPSKEPSPQPPTPPKPQSKDVPVASKDENTLPKGYFCSNCTKTIIYPIGNGSTATCATCGQSNLAPMSFYAVTEPDGRQRGGLLAQLSVLPYDARKARFGTGPLILLGHVDYFWHKLLSKAFAQYPPVSITEADIQNQLMCGVCLEQLQPTSVAGNLCCGHKFHVKCIFEWLLKHNNCPYCRRVIENKNEDLE